MSSNVTGLLTEWERKTLLDKLHGIEVKPEHLRAVKYRVKKRLEQAFRDIQLIRAIWPEIITSVTELVRPPGFEPGTAGSEGQRPSRLDDGRLIRSFSWMVLSFSPDLEYSF